MEGRTYTLWVVEEDGRKWNFEISEYQARKALEAPCATLGWLKLGIGIEGKCRLELEEKKLQKLAEES